MTFARGIIRLRNGAVGRYARRAAPLLACATWFVALAGCGADSPGTPHEPPAGGAQPAAIAAAVGDGQRATVANAVPANPTVRVTDAAGAPVAGATVSFSVTSGGGWTERGEAATGSDGLASVRWYLGATADQPQQLAAHVGGGLTVTFTATADTLVAGATYFGANGYVEFRAGDLPLIVSAPHGGTLEPVGIPDRTGNVTTVRDANTDELAADIVDAFLAATGNAPHTVIVHLHRRKLDANREIVEAAQGNAAAELAWREYHAFIEAAHAHVARAHGRGFYVDLHGHGHAIQRLEFGYTLSASDLARDDAGLNDEALVRSSSIRSLAARSPRTHAALLRGSHSLGSLFEAHGYPSVPSAAQPDPGGAPYFTGGYNTRRYGSRDGGEVDGVQLEANRIGVRDTAANRRAFAAAFTAVLREYLAVHYAPELSAAPGASAR